MRCRSCLDGWAWGPCCLSLTGAALPQCTYKQPITLHGRLSVCRLQTGGADRGPQEVVSKAKIPMMDVVAEMMIAANAAVARRVANAFPGAALLRCHPPPRPEAFEQVCVVCLVPSSLACG